MNKDKDLLIIGCGRSGTKYIASLLREMGVDIKHETPGRHGSSNWYFTPLDKMRPGPYGAKWNFLDYDYKSIFHQIRDPLDSISSIVTLTPKSWAWLKSWVPIEKDDSLLKKSMKYWYHWNVMAEQNAQWSYKVEDFPIIYEKFFNIIGRSELLNPDSIKVLKSYSTTVNSRLHSKVTWMDLQREDYTLCSYIRELAYRHGYANNID